MSIRTIVIAALTLPAIALTGCQDKDAPAPKTTAVPKPAPKPPTDATLPGLATSGAANEMAPGVWIWDLQEGDGSPVGPDSRTVTVSIEGWTQDGTQYFGSTAGPDELVLPAGGAAAFPGWNEAIDGLRIGGTRKVWAAAPEDATGWPVEHDSPVILDITLHAIDANADLANPLPGADVAGAAAQGGAHGLRFYQLAAGEGTPAARGDAVSIRYEAWLGDGTPMASATDEPVTITLDDTIAPGVAAGLEGVSAGGKRKLVIPASIGIGFDPLGTLPPGSTVVMDVDVVDVNRTTAEPAPATAEAG